MDALFGKVVIMMCTMGPKDLLAVFSFPPFEKKGEEGFVWNGSENIDLTNYADSELSDSEETEASDVVAGLFFLL